MNSAQPLNRKAGLAVFLLLIAYAGIATSSDVAQTAALPAQGVSYFAAGTVEAAFDKGAVLFESPHYMVHASRREAPGQAEVHLKDADLIHVLQGTATFVTGGEVVDGKETAPDEIRGASIKGGSTLRLAKGDVVIVPEGTPHWFQRIEGPFLYYVVKVR